METLEIICFYSFDFSTGFNIKVETEFCFGREEEEEKKGNSCGKNQTKQLKLTQSFHISFFVFLTKWFKSITISANDQILCN